MALRFKRRIRIAPGISLNLSKGGIGASIGPRGAKLNIGPRGVYSNVGLPGTGLSYRQKLNKSGNRTAGNKQTTASTGKVLEQQILAGHSVSTHVHINDSCEVVITDENGHAFDDSELRVLKKYAEQGLRDMLQQACERLNADLASLATIHHDTPTPRDKPVVESQEFPEPEPKPSPMYLPTLWSRIWPPAARRIKEENERQARQHTQAMSKWKEAARIFNEKERQRCSHETRLILSDLDVMATVMEKHLGEIPWPRETNVSFDLGDDAGTIAIDIELPEEGDFPDAEYMLAGKQLKVSAKKITATRRRALYRDYAHGVAMRVLGEIFHRLPTVQVALISAYTPAMDVGTGKTTENYLYSVLATKHEWREINFKALADIEPSATLEGFELRRKMTKTGIFKPIEPFEVEVLSSVN